MTKKKTHENRESFINNLMSMTGEQINDYILNKSKKPKPINPFIVIIKHDEIDNTPKEEI